MTTIHTRVVACARTWIGTRFCHQGRLKKTDDHKGGVDCLGLLVGVARELNLTLRDGTSLTRFDETNYSHYPDSERLRERLGKALEVIKTEVIHPGAIALFALDENPQHLGIISDRGPTYGIIHAYAPARSVVEHDLNGWWHAHIACAYQIKQ